MADDYQPLIESCERLIQLLRDPHPGLFTWHEAVQQRRREIWEYETPPDKREDRRGLYA